MLKSASPVLSPPFFSRNSNTLKRAGQLAGTARILVVTAKSDRDHRAEPSISSTLFTHAVLIHSYRLLLLWLTYVSIILHIAKPRLLQTATAWNSEKSKKKSWPLILLLMACPGIGHN